MHKSGKWLIRIAVTGILFLLLFCGCAAADKPAVTASCPSVCGEKVAARVTKSEQILDLPGSWDLTRIVLEIGDLQTAYFGPDRTEIPLGRETDLSGLVNGQRLAVRNEKQVEVASVRVEQGSRIPAMFLEADKTTLSKANINKNIQVTEGRMLYLEADGSVSYDGALQQLRGRGNNSFLYSKKPYQLKLQEKASLSGMGRGKTWVLLANWVDVSLLRNQIVLDLCRQTGMRNAVSCVQADVWINGVYHGLYLLTEKIQIGKGRIDITNLEKETEKVNPVPFDPGKMYMERSAEHPILRCYPGLADPEDITGGYIMTIEKPGRMDGNRLAGFRTEGGLNIRIKEPTCPSKAQTEYLFSLITEMHSALAASDGTNSATGKSYGEYLDADSFAQRFLIEDWTKNYDYLGGSIFMYKDSDTVDPLIYAGPSWDYDLCFGNMRNVGPDPTGRHVTGKRNASNIWWALFRHDSFRRKLCDVWQKEFRPAVAVLLGEKEAGPDSVIRPLDEYRDHISASVEMNTRRWGISKEATGIGSGGGFDKAVEFLRKWITKRTAWMDEAYTPEAMANIN